MPLSRPTVDGPASSATAICRSARCDDRHRRGRCASAARARPAGRCRRPRAHPLLVVDHAPVRASLGSIETLLPILYLKGISTGYFFGGARCFADASGPSASMIGRLKDGCQEDHVT
jgi:hypothetical protein